MFGASRQSLRLKVIDFTFVSLLKVLVGLVWRL